MSTGRPRVRRDPGRRVLDSRHPALRRHAARRGRRQVLQAAVSAAGPDDDARPALHHRLSLRRNLPLGAVPRRPGPDRPGDLPCSSGASRPNPTRWQYAQDAGFVHYWWRQDYKAAAEWFDRASRIEGAPWWLRSMAATHAGRGRRPSVVAAAVAAALRDHRRHLGAEQRAVEAGAAQGARRDRRAGVAGPPLRGGARDGARPRGTNWSRCGWLAGVPLDPSGTPYELKPDAPGGVALSERSSLSPLPPQFARKTGPTS